ncbi:MAG TPA: NADPH-dependent F420 reductase [Nitrososphaeraceae archaeon]|nr:NADPH-dependent F420 reductase [Nitrososphaeraceae archaeon]
MRVGIIGGTGGMGKGFALRWCFGHDVTIGSRDAQKAKEVAQSYTEVAREAYGNSMTGSISGDDNFSLAKNSDILILSIPYESINDTCDKLVREVRNNCVIVSPIVPMARTDAGFIYLPLEEGKKFAAEIVAIKLPPRSRVVSAFHTISEIKLINVKRSLDADTFVCGDDQGTVAILNTLISDINGLRSIYLGPLSMTYQAEILTPMLLNAAKRNKMKHPGIRLV